MKKNYQNKKAGNQSYLGYFQKSPKPLGSYALSFSLTLFLLLFSFKGKSQYCNTAFSNVTYEFVKGVNYAGINNTSGGNTGGPVNYTTQVANVTQGITYSITVTIDDDYSDYVYVFIDWNQNGTLNDAGETYTLGVAVGSGANNLVLPAYGILTPMTAVPGTTRMRVICDWNNATADPCRVATYGEAEDYSVNVIASVPCNGAPALTSVVGPTNEICPGAGLGLSLANNYTVSGITYTWVASTTSSAGPWTPITGTSAAVSVPNNTSSAYFTAVVGCNAGGVTTLTPYQSSVQAVITNTPPYFEGFEGIIAENKLPNCSWSATSLGPNLSNQTYTMSNNNNRVPHNGSKFASFYYISTGDSYFYTNGIYLTAGVTYSAGLWYTTESYGYNNWSDLSIMYGTTQSTTGLNTIVSTNGPAISPTYKLLSNTFQVATTGVYYVAVKATNQSGAYAYYLSWDDLFITIPCTAQSANNPTMTLSADNATICAGETVHMTATGADTYTWSTGDMIDNIYQEPIYNTTYQVVGTNAITGCTATLSQTINVNPSPSVFVIANKQTICAGETATLTGVGGVTYTWTGSTSTNSIVNVSPTTSTTYSVWGANNYGCAAMAIQVINVNQLPNVGATTPKTDKICEGESVVLTATGGSAFVWVSNTSSSLLAGANVTVSPTVPTTYTVTGTDINGCSNVATVSQNVDACTGIKENASGMVFSVYPNPGSGEFVLESESDLNGAYVEVTDMTGKEVLRNIVTEKKSTIDLSSVSNGVYFLKVRTASSVNTVKLIKQ